MSTGPVPEPVSVAPVTKGRAPINRVIPVCLLRGKKAGESKSDRVWIGIAEAR